MREFWILYFFVLLDFNFLYHDLFFQNRRPIRARERERKIGTFDDFERKKVNDDDLTARRRKEQQLCVQINMCI